MARQDRRYVRHVAADTHKRPSGLQPHCRGLSASRVSFDADCHRQTAETGAAGPAPPRAYHLSDAGRADRRAPPATHSQTRLAATDPSATSSSTAPI